VEGVHKIIQSAAGPKTEIGQMLFSDALYNQIRQPILNIDHMLEEIQRGETPTGRLFTSDATYNNALAPIRNVHQTLIDLNAGKGNGQMLKSDDQYRKLEAQLRNIDRTIDQLTTGNGKFAQLLASRQMYDSLDVRAKTTGTFLKEFRETPQKFLRIKPFGSKKSKTAATAPKTKPTTP
jgi:hypothetical protein